jgi:hypothetical protein
MSYKNGQDTARPRHSQKGSADCTTDSISIGPPQPAVQFTERSHQFAAFGLDLRTGCAAPQTDENFFSQPGLNYCYLAVPGLFGYH